jgi:hypothetical protein
MIKLDANTRGAVEVIDALNSSRSAADVAGAAIDRALSKMDKLPGHSELKSRLAAENAGWDSAIKGAKGRIAAEDATTRSIRNRGAMMALETHEIEKQNEQAAASVEPMWKSVLKGEMVMEAIKEGAHLALETVRRLGEGVIDVFKEAGKSERTEKVFDNLLGKEGGRDTLEYLDKFSGLSEFTNDALKPMAAAMLQVGVRGADLRNAIAASADVAAGSVDKMGAFSAAMESLTRIARTGRVDNRILGGLALNPHDVEKQLAKDLSLAPETIKKKLEEGTLKGVEAMDSIFTVMEAKSGKQLGSLGLEMADTLEARMDKLKEIPEKLFKSMKNTQGFVDFSGVIGDILKVFGPESEVGEKIKSSLSDTIDRVGRELKSIDWKNVGDVVLRVVDATKDWVEPLAAVAKFLGKVVDLLSTLTALPTFGKDIGNWFGQGELERQKFDFERQMKNRGGGKSVFNDEGKELQTSFQREVIENAGAANERAWKESGADKAFTKNGEVAGASIEDGARAALKSNSPSRVWMDIGEDCADGFDIGFRRASSRNQSAIDGISPAPIGSFAGASVGGNSFRIEPGAISITLAVSGGSPQEAGREAAEQTAATLLPMLEQFATQAGLA